MKVLLATYTPVAAWYMPDTHVERLHMCSDNLRRFTAGEPPGNRIDKKAGY